MTSVFPTVMRLKIIFNIILRLKIIFKRLQIIKITNLISSVDENIKKAIMFTY